jgi:glucokinase
MLIEKIDTLTEKIDVMEASREEERRAFQMALRKYDEKYQEWVLCQPGMFDLYKFVQ